MWVVVELCFCATVAYVTVRTFKIHTTIQKKSNIVTQKIGSNIYKTVIRSQLEYGAQVIDYTNMHVLNKLEELQIQSLRCLLHIPSTTPDAAILISTDILTVENRFNELKMNFFMKQRTSESLAGHLVRTLLEHGQYMQPFDNNDIPLPYHTIIKAIFRQYGPAWQKTMYYAENDIDPAAAKSFIHISIHNYNYHSLLPKNK